MHLHLGVVYPPVTVISDDGRIARIEMIQCDFFCGGGDHDLGGGLRGCSFRYGGGLLRGHRFVFGVLLGVVLGIVLGVVLGVVFVVFFVVVLGVVFFGDSGDVVVFVVVLVTCR